MLGTDLEEAVRLFEGVKGLEALALEKGHHFPGAFAEWLEALKNDKNYREMIFVARLGREKLSDRLVIRARIADYFHETASQLDQKDLIEDSRWRFAKTISRPSGESFERVFHPREGAGRIFSCRRESSLQKSGRHCERKTPAKLLEGSAVIIGRRRDLLEQRRSGSGAKADPSFQGKVQSPLRF